MKKIEDVTMALIAFLAIIITILDFTGNLEKYPFIEANYLKFVLLLISTIALYLIASNYRNKKFEKEASSFLHDLVKNESKEYVQVFESSSALETYLAYRINSAQKEICDLSWKKTISPQYNLGVRKQTQLYYDKATSTRSKEIVYKEIFIFNDIRRFDKFKKRLKEKRAGYSCGYYTDEKIPRLQFVIIDDEEVVFFACSLNSLLCSIKGKHIVGIFRPYFDELWSNATKLIDGSNIYQDEIDKIENKYK